MNSVDEPDDSRPWHERHPFAWGFLVGFAVCTLGYCWGYADGRRARS